MVSKGTKMSAKDFTSRASGTSFPTISPSIVNPVVSVRLLGVPDVDRGGVAIGEWEGCTDVMMEADDDKMEAAVGAEEEEEVALVNWFNGIFGTGLYSKTLTFILWGT